MSVTITANVGATAVSGVIRVKNDLRVADFVDITGSISVSGDLSVKEGITENSGAPVLNTFELVIFSVDTDTSNVYYTVTPRDCRILGAYVANTETVDQATTLTLDSDESNAHDETIAVGIGDLNEIGVVTETIFDDYYEVNGGHAISVTPANAASDAGVVNVTLICQLADVT